MQGYDIVLFDLDGTLTDSKIGITKSVQYALKKYNIIEDDLDRLEKFIGPPLADSFKEYYNFEERQAKQAVAYYREYFTDRGIFENIVYPGIPELLKKLCQYEKRLIVATSKPTIFAERILEHFNLKKYFSFVIGSNLDGTRVAKSEIIETVLGKLPTIKKCSVVMIGDRIHDIKGAEQNNIASIAVSYGYGSDEELKEAKPTYLVDNIDEIEDILCS